MVEVTVFVEAEINPTESEDKVKAAVNNVLGNATITIKPAIKGSTLTRKLKGKIHLLNFAICCTTTEFAMRPENCFSSQSAETRLSFCLNKQVAFAGHVSFSEETAESPLGPIRVNIETDNPQQLIEWLAEKT